MTRDFKKATAPGRLAALFALPAASVLCLTVVALALTIVCLFSPFVGSNNNNNNNNMLFPRPVSQEQPMAAAAAAAAFFATAVMLPSVASAQQQQQQQQVDLNWYPPASSQINNLTAALTTEHGVYGFVFNSSQTPAAAGYGTYNWCNMPHARAAEYVVPSKEYKLKYVEVMQRHHKRTPYASNSFPVESYPWNCDDQGLYFYGAPFIGSQQQQQQGFQVQSNRQPARAYWRGTTSSINPFVAKGWQGSCQFPQITAGGLDDSFIHGDDLYKLYHDKLGFLPARNYQNPAAAWQQGKVAFRVTNNVITSQVAGMFIAGMYPALVPGSQQVPLIIQASGVDSLEPQYSCSTASSMFNKIKSSANARWQDHLTKSAQLVATLDAISGVPASPNDGGFHASFDHYYDNLSARQCHTNKPLPCKTGGACVTQDLADAVYRLGQWEYSHIYRDAGPDSLAASAASIGVWAAELASHLRAKMADGAMLYMHNFAHDGSTSRLLGLLQIDTMVWPGMGAEIVFELYQKSSGSWHVRVLFGGKVLKSSNPSLGVMDMLPVETLLAYFDGLVGKDASLVKGKCSS
ncbi:2-phosphoxylose phosphatase [Microdochium nivale]|nr:2-phosphoxylose phosphatase [Microdochium nivale]